jgi:hypothetical protein
MAAGPPVGYDHPVRACLPSRDNPSPATQVPSARRTWLAHRCGITVYPPRDKGGRWRAVWHEDGERQQCESVSEEKLAAKLDKVRQRLAMGASSMTRAGADLIAWYLNPDRLPVADRWSRKHADTQRRLCELFAARVIGAVTCQGITGSHAQKIVNAAPTTGEGDRVHRMLSKARGLLLVMPAAAVRVAARAPARAVTRASPSLRAGVLRPSASAAGCAIRSKAGPGAAGVCSVSRS